MKSFFKLIGLAVFTAFSFYYTSIVIELSTSNDLIMTSINDYSKEFDSECIEGIINSEGVILGVSGLKVNKNKSYSNMRGQEYDIEKLEYNIDECILSYNNNYDKYILSINPLKNSSSILIDVDSGKYYKDFYKISQYYGVNIDFIITHKFLNDNYDAITELFNNNIIFKGSSKEELNRFNKKIKTFDNYKNFMCVDKSNIIDYCKEIKSNTIKYENIIENNLLLNTKKNYNKGDIIIIKENLLNLKEFPLTINYIKGLGINIDNILVLIK